MAKRDGFVSVAAWDAVISDFDKRFRDLENRVKRVVSVGAWDAVIKDFNERFDKLNARVNELNEKINSRVSVSAWNRANEELVSKINSRVSVSAWEKSLEDLDNNFKNLALNDLKKLDSRLDRITELINRLSDRLSSKVSVSAWNQFMDSNAQLISDFSKLRSKVNSNTRDLIKIKDLISEASVTEDELRELLNSI